MRKEYVESDQIRCEDGDKLYFIPRKLFMKMLTGIKTEDRRFVRYDTGAEIYGLGKRTFMKLAKDAGAKYKYGESVLVNTEKVDQYLESFREPGEFDI